MNLVFISLLIVIQTAIAKNIDDSVKLQYYEPTYKIKPIKKYTEQMTEPKVNWAYWRRDQSLTENQSVEKSDFAMVDCELTPNLIYWDEKHLTFDKNFDFEWIDQGYKKNYLKQVNAIMKRCPNAKIVLDYTINWNKEFSSQIKKTSTKTIVKNLLSQTLSSKSKGIVITFVQDTVLNDDLTREFFKELNYVFKKQNLIILGFFKLDDSKYQNVRPVVIDYLDEFLLNTYPFTNTVLQHQVPAFSDDYRSVEGVIDLFINFGVPKNKISVLFPAYGISLNRINCDSNTDIGCPSGGKATTYLFAEEIFTQYSKDTNTAWQDYKTVCRVINDPTWTKAFDDIEKVPYAYNDKYWLSFDDYNSWKIKVDIVKKKQISGVVIDDINYDDIKGYCDGTPYPVVRAIKSLFETNNY